MITKGEIQSIDFNTNKCLVRIPIFESAGYTDKNIQEAMICITPGQYNSYQPGDIVFIGFENNFANAPIVLGKLYIVQQETARGAVSSNSLIVTESCEIPINTRIKPVNTPDTTVSINGSIEKYQSILDITNKLQELENKIEILQAALNNSTNI